jgi:hypothetical protein
MTQMVFLHGMWLTLNCVAICIPIYKVCNSNLNFFSFFFRVFAFQIKFPPTNDDTDRAISLAKKIFTYAIIFHVTMLAVSYLII